MVEPYAACEAICAKRAPAIKSDDKRKLLYLVLLRQLEIGGNTSFAAAQRPGGVADISVRREVGRVEMWRGICRSDISVSASFVWRCLSGPTMAPFPHPAHRTGRADFPHPALGQDLTPLFWRATPSAGPEPFLEFIGRPISQVLHHVLRLS